DAGEPKGSAGLPILQQLEAAQLVDVLAVVVRHFGGVKLGIGGLVRAYAGVTAAALSHASVVERRVETTLRIRFPHEVNAAVMRIVHRHGARVLGIRYDTQGEMAVALPPSRALTFTDAVREETGARASVEREP
ncbi:MAG: YigZ family protein, partial [Candidatus Bipolaricaulota bacterium]|nr:YigZ family protein [Candidatus Bipolaricaulota bacterium]